MTNDIDFSHWNFSHSKVFRGKVIILSNDKPLEEANIIRKQYEGHCIFVIKRRPTVFEVLNFPTIDCTLISEGGSSCSEEFNAAKEFHRSYANHAVGAIDLFLQRNLVTLDCRGGIRSEPAKRPFEIRTDYIEDEANKHPASGDMGNGMSARQNYYFDVANQLSALGAYDEADAYYLKADELAPGHPCILNNRGGNYTRWGKLIEAEKSLRQAIRKDTTHKLARKNLGDVLFKAGRNEEALRQYERAIEIDDNYGNAWYGRGNVLLAVESYLEAEQCFRKAITLDPKSIHFRINLGAALSFQEKYEPALAAYKGAHELDRNLPGLEKCIEYIRSRMSKSSS